MFLQCVSVMQLLWGEIQELCLCVQDSYLPFQPLCPGCDEDAPAERITEDQQALEQTAALHYFMLQCEGKVERTCKLAHNTVGPLEAGLFRLYPLSSSKEWRHVFVCRADALAYFVWQALAHFPVPQSSSAHVDPGLLPLLFVFSLNLSTVEI